MVHLSNVLIGQFSVNYCTSYHGTLWLVWGRKKSSELNLKTLWLLDSDRVQWLNYCTPAIVLIVAVRLIQWLINLTPHQAVKDQFTPKKVRTRSKKI